MSFTHCTYDTAAILHDTIYETGEGPRILDPIIYIYIFESPKPLPTFVSVTFSSEVPGRRKVSTSLKNRR